MSQQTFSPGGTQVAEPPAPVLPVGDGPAGSDDNRRKLMMVGAAVGLLVLGIVAFFLMKGGSSTNADAPFAIVHHPAKAAPAAAPPVVKLPKHVAAPVGRDPFKALVIAGAAAPAGAASTTTGGSTSPTTTGSTPTTTTGSGGTTPTTTTQTYHPVWVQLKSVTTTATFDVGYSNGKTLKAVRYTGVRPLHTFAGTFELLSIRNGVVTVKYGDGSPFTLDRSHNTMVVD